MRFCDFLITKHVISLAFFLYWNLQFLSAVFIYLFKKNQIYIYQQKRQINFIKFLYIWKFGLRCVHCNRIFHFRLEIHLIWYFMIFYDLCHKRLFSKKKLYIVKIHQFIIIKFLIHTHIIVHFTTKKVDYFSD